MNTSEIELQISTFTGTAPGIINYTVVDNDKDEYSLIEINSIRSPFTFRDGSVCDMLPAVDGQQLFILKMVISQHEAEKAQAA